MATSPSPPREWPAEHDARVWMGAIVGDRIVSERLPVLPGIDACVEPPLIELGREIIHSGREEYPEIAAEDVDAGVDIRAGVGSGRRCKHGTAGAAQKIISSAAAASLFHMAVTPKTVLLN